MRANSYWPNGQSWKRYWPGSIVSLIAVLQLFVSFFIVGLHIAILVIGLVSLCAVFKSWYVMGFICWGFFMTCWISIFCVSCCNRSSVACATYVMITNVLAFIFAAVLISFDSKFINGQLSADSVTSSLDCITSYQSTVNMSSIFLGITKGQLAGSVFILVSSLVFIAIYIYVYIRAVFDDEHTPNDNLRWTGQNAPNQALGYGMST
ncbi:unnamed protein product [Rotaria magnacalcarata]|uniref:Uncharacterized protein n=2 Tax=Rotaria magnacalcarata TaxID=392030 RepID=A0A816N2B9_9BILA|nr:unnamed protein product [Rotaria magnacalcarata]CAF2004003.1 unnamed protein product [Rotaria magnacalcarata]CAF2073200.1 unnamed protein product [Rotaria magnacalcarata]CAF4142193.1 unnamed protein product [Rotaria magnacalcarata]